MNDGLHTIIKRYARAFLNCFLLDDNDIAQIKQARLYLEGHEELFSLLKVPALDARIKKNALVECLVTRFKLPGSFEQLVALLVTHKKADLINHILAQIEIMYHEQKGIETFTISSTSPLTTNDISTVQLFLASKTQHTIVCNARIDSSLIAGIRMQSADRMWEYSIRKQLAALQSTLND